MGQHGWRGAASGESAGGKQASQTASDCGQGGRDQESCRAAQGAIAGLLLADTYGPGRPCKAVDSSNVSGHMVAECQGG